MNESWMFTKFFLNNISLTVYVQNLCLSHEQIQLHMNTGKWMHTANWIWTWKPNPNLGKLTGREALSSAVVYGLRYGVNVIPYPQNVISFGTTTGNFYAGISTHVHLQISQKTMHKSGNMSDGRNSLRNSATDFLYLAEAVTFELFFRATRRIICKHTAQIDTRQFLCA